MFTEEERNLIETNVVKDFGKLETNVARNANQSLINRIKSIQVDVEFVERIRHKVNYLPIVANLRNGRWYVKKPTKSNDAGDDGQEEEEEETLITSYFKSTDGHERNWNFNSQRANLNIIHLALSKGGVIIVDSTRFGMKRYPDSFNRTVPLWVALVNHALLFGEKKEAVEEEDVIYDLIKEQLPDWLHDHFFLPKPIKQNFFRWSEEIKKLWMDYLAIHPLVEKRDEIVKPFQTFFIRNDEKAWGKDDVTNMLDFDAVLDYCIPIVLLSASANDLNGEEHREHFSFHYIAGSGDDEENWNDLKITPSLLHSNLETLCNCKSEEEVKNCLLQLNSGGLGDEKKNQTIIYRLYSKDLGFELQLHWKNEASSNEQQHFSNPTWFRKMQKQLKTLIDMELNKFYTHVTEQQGTTKPITYCLVSNDKQYLIFVAIAIFSSKKFTHDWIFKEEEEVKQTQTPEEIKKRVKNAISHVCNLNQFTLERKYAKELIAYFVEFLL